MSRVCALVDGFNLYHALERNKRFRQYKWLDLKKLAQCFVSREDQIEHVFYYTAYAIWNQAKVNRHKVYIRALSSVGVNTVLGEFRRRDRHCPDCKSNYISYEEKKTDVNIAVSLFKLAVEDLYNKVLIISGDSDLIPAIEAVKESFPAKKIGVVIPPGGRAELLKAVTHFYQRIKEKHLKSCLFEDAVMLQSGQKVCKPKLW